MPSTYISFGYVTKRIAAIGGISLNTIRSQYSQARRGLFASFKTKRNASLPLSK